MLITEYDMICYIIYVTYILNIDKTYTHVRHIVLYIIYPTTLAIYQSRLALCDWRRFTEVGLGRLGDSSANRRVMKAGKRMAGWRQPSLLTPKNGF